MVSCDRCLVRQEFVFQTTGMSVDSIDTLVEQLSTDPRVRWNSYYPPDYLHRDTTHLFLGREVAPTRILMMALARGKVKLVKLEDFERHYSTNGPDGADFNFSVDCVPRDGLLMNGVFLRHLEARNKFTKLANWTVIVALQDIHHHERFVDVLRECGATVLQCTLEKALVLLQDEKDSLGTTLSRILVEPNGEMMPIIQDILRVIRLRRLKIDIVKHKYLTDLLISRLGSKMYKYRVIRDGSGMTEEVTDHLQNFQEAVVVNTNAMIMSSWFRMNEASSSLGAEQRSLGNKVHSDASSCLGAGQSSLGNKGHSDALGARPGLESCNCAGQGSLDIQSSIGAPTSMGTQTNSPFAAMPKPIEMNPFEVQPGDRENEEKNDRVLVTEEYLNSLDLMAKDLNVFGASLNHLKRKLEDDLNLGQEHVGRHEESQGAPIVSRRGFDLRAKHRIFQDLRVKLQRLQRDFDQWKQK